MRGDTHLILLNTTVSTWSLTDYLEHYIEMGISDYQILKDFSSKYGFSYSNALAILSIGSYYGSTEMKAPLHEFKNGAWRIVNLKEADSFANRYLDIANYTEETTSRDRDLLRAVFRMYYVLDVLHEDFMQKLKIYPYPIYRRLGVKDYLRQLEEIYNFDKKGSKTIRFF